MVQDSTFVSLYMSETIRTYLIIRGTVLLIMLSRFYPNLATSQSLNSCNANPSLHISIWHDGLDGRHGLHGLHGPDGLEGLQGLDGSDMVRLL